MIFTLPPEYLTLVDRAAELLSVGRQGTDRRSRDVLERLAHRVRTLAEDQALLSLRTTQEVADELGIDRSRVRRLADARGLGARIGRERVFRPSDVDAMRSRPPGRPRRPAP